MGTNRPAKDPVNVVRDLEELLDDPTKEAQEIPYTLIENIISGNKHAVGGGGYAYIHLGVLGNNKKVAVKEIFYKQQDTDEELLREISFIKKANNHPNIVRMVGYSVDKKVEVKENTSGQNSKYIETRKRYLCLEYALGGDLHDYIKRLQANTKGSDEVNWTTYYQIIMGICKGLEHIHKQEIIHLDLKPKNILLDVYSRAKITDFGVARFLAEVQPEAKDKLPRGTVCGTTGFQAPELLDGEDISYKSDIYALGATIARLLMRKNSGDVEKWLKKNSTGENLPKEKRCFIDIVWKCMEPNPTKRNILDQTIKQLEKMDLQYINPDDSEKVLKVEPKKMVIRSEKVSSTLSLVNRTGEYVAYMISMSGSDAEYTRDTIGPQSTHAVDLPREASAKFLVQSTVVPTAIDAALFPTDMFSQDDEGRIVSKVEVVMVVELGGNQVIGGSSGSLDVEPRQEIKLSSKFKLFNVSTAFSRALNRVKPPRGGGTGCLLDVQPRQLCIPFEPNKYIPCALHLRNDSNKYVAFELVDDFGWVFHTPNTRPGIVPPGSTHTLIITPEKRKTLPEIRQQHSDPTSRAARLEALLEDMKLHHICKEDIDDILVLRTSVVKDKQEFDEFIDGDHYEASGQLKAVYNPAGGMTSQETQDGTKIISVVKTRESLTLLSNRFTDTHPKEPWTIGINSSGSDSIEIWDFEMQRVIPSCKVSEKSGKLYDFAVIFNYFLKVAKFIASKQWLMVSSMDDTTRVFEYEVATGDQCTFTKIHEFGDKFKLLVAHPTKPYVLAYKWYDSDIMLWCWENSWECTQTYEKRHTGKVCFITFNPVDDNTGFGFASASKDYTIKLWDLDSPRCRRTLVGHRGKVKCLDFFTSVKKQYLVSGSSDDTAKIWDMQEMTCVRTLYGFGSAVLSVSAHPNHPVIITGTEGGLVHVWSSTDFRLKRTFDMSNGGPVRTLACHNGSRRVVNAQEDLLSVMYLGDEDVTTSEDGSENSRSPTANEDE